MQIDHLLVEDIVLDSTRSVGLAKSTLYDFRQPQWVSTHRERVGRPIGPVNLINIADDAIDGVLNVSIRPFGERELVTEGSPAQPVISYRDMWTVPDLTLYTVVIPKYYVPERLYINSRLDVSLQTGITHSQQLFYYALFADWKSNMHEFSVEFRIEKNEKRYFSHAKDIEIVEGTNRFKDFKNAVVGRISNPEFMLKLFDIAAKYFHKS